MSSRKINKIGRIKGDNNYIFQYIDSEGNSTEVRKTLEEILENNSLVQEKEKRINELQEHNALLKETKGLLNNEVISLSTVITQLKAEKSQMKAQIIDFIKQVEGKSLSDGFNGYQTAVSLLIEGDIDQALVELDEVKMLESELAAKDQMRLQAEARWLKGILFGLKLDMTNATRNVELAAELYPTWYYNYHTGYINYTLLKFEKAELYYKKALENSKIPNEQALTLQNYGVLLAESHRHDEADEKYKQAYQLWNTIAADDPDHNSRIIEILNNLGLNAMLKGDFEDAQSLFENGIALVSNAEQEAADEGLFKMATLMSNYAGLKRRQERYVDSKELLLHSLKIRKSLLTIEDQAKNSQIADIYNNLGNLCLDEKKYMEAEEAYRKALKIKKELAEDIPEIYLPKVASFSASLGAALQYQKKYAEAEKYGVDAVEISRSLLTQQPKTITRRLVGALNNLGYFYQTCRIDISKSRELYDEAIELILKQIPTVEYQQNLAIILENIELTGMDPIAYMKTKDLSSFFDQL